MMDVFQSSKYVELSEPLSRHVLIHVFVSRLQARMEECLRMVRGIG